MRREYGAFVPTAEGQQPGHVLANALLIIGRDSGGYWLLELDPNNQPTFNTGHGFHTIGSGSPAAYLAQGLVKEYAPAALSLDHMKLMAYRTVDTCIRVLGGRLGLNSRAKIPLASVRPLVPRLVPRPSGFPTSSRSETAKARFPSGLPASRGDWI